MPAAGLAASWLLALLKPDSAGAGLWASRALFTALLGAAIAGCLLGARRTGGDRPGWTLIGAGLGFWLIGNLAYWAGEPGQSLAPFPWQTDVFYLAYYVAILLGLHAMAGNGALRSRASFGMLVGLLGMTSLWAWLVTTRGLFDGGDSGGQTAQAVAYPVLDLVLVAIAILLVSARRIASDRSLLALTAGLTVVAAGDTLYGIDVAVDAGLTDELVANAAWSTGVVMVGFATWLRPPGTELSQDDRPALRLALGAATVAVFVLTWDHFERVSDLTLVLAALTVLASTVQVALLYRQRVTAEVEVQAASIRSARALALTVDAKDRATHSHSDRVAQILMALARQVGVDPRTLARLELAGHLHDIGKISIPEALLMKPEALTEAEYELMKHHAPEGAAIVSAAGLDDIALWIRHHHERWNGDGYPDGLMGTQIPLESRLLGAADALDAMVSDRPYQPPMAAEDAVAELRAGAGTQFDPDVATKLAELLESGEIDLGRRHTPVEDLEQQIEVELVRTPA